MAKDEDSQLILRVEELCKSYPTPAGKLTVLQDVSLTVRTGSANAVVGPSGSGKTTLLGLCAGLDVPSSGSVVLNRVSLGELEEDEKAELRNSCVGFVFQNFQLLPTLTALENVMVPLELRASAAGQRQALELLAKVELEERAHHYPIQLSGGEQQRVALARAFINEPDILFVDEPTGNLDADSSEQVADLLFDLNREAGTTLMVATHDPFIASRADRVFRIRNGTLIDGA